MHDLRKWMSLFEASKAIEEAAVWHASPHNFDQFRLGWGSGEGGNAYGWGLYFTDSKDVADWYKAQFIRRFGKNYTYKVQIPDEDYLLWDTPLTTQSAKVQKIAISAYNLINGRIVFSKTEDRGMNGETRTWYRWQLYRSKVLITSGSSQSEEETKMAAKKIFPARKDYLSMSGEDFYRNVVQSFAYRDGGGSTLHGAYQWNASNYLKEKGLVGIKYWNGVGNGYNYVIFDNASISMIDKAEPSS